MLADFIKGPDRRSMSPAFLDGIRQHQAIDAFTNAHPIVWSSKARIRDYPHLTGILIDIFYDHFLSIRWHRYSTEPLDVFTARLYGELNAHQSRMPAIGQAVVARIIADDWLGSYRSIDGIEQTLRRLSRRLEARLGRKLGLEGASSELLAHFDALDRDFAAFFPLLQAHARF